MNGTERKPASWRQWTLPTSQRWSLPSAMQRWEGRFGSGEGILAGIQLPGLVRNIGILLLETHLAGDWAHGRRVSGISRLTT